MRICGTAFLLITLLLACGTGQKPSASDQKKAMQLFKQGGDIMVKGFEMYVGNASAEGSISTSHLPYFRQAIGLFQEAMKADPTVNEYGIYMEDLYMGIRNYDSAIYWRRRNESIFGAQRKNKGPGMSLSDPNLFFGRCYLYSGEIDSATFYFKKAAKTSEEHAGTVGNELFKYSRKLKYPVPTWDTEMLPKHIDRCAYNIAIMELGREISKDHEWMADTFFSQDSINLMKKRCQ